MHISETAIPSTPRPKPHIDVTSVTGTRGVHEDVRELFQTVYGEPPVCEGWPIEAVRDRFNNLFDGQVLPICFAAWGNKKVGEPGKLIGLLTGFELQDADHWRAFGIRSMAGEIRHGYGADPGRTGYVQDLLVTASCRGRRVGQAMLAQAEAYFRGQRMTTMFCRARAAEADPFRVSCMKNGWRDVASIDQNYVLIGIPL